ncbi:piwi-like protein 3 isoform X2 [Cavia porcellus]|uniref:piwi-like protein 3 isoform X2 n=1 Tax=Cavia porcellus TaxID=10141 RepID=UPI002FDF7DC9
MSGRARTRARGRARHWNIAQAEAPGAAAASPAQQAASPQPRRQPPREEGRVAAPEQPRGAEGGVQPPGGLSLAANLQALSVRPGTPAGIFQDLVVNTREKLRHVRHSKTGSEGSMIELLANHFQNMELISRTKEGGIVKITVCFSRELGTTHPDCIRYYNIFLRRILKLMNLKQIGRNYYNDANTRTFFSSSLETIPGYVTSILPYEQSLTLCSDTCFKLLQSRTVFDVIRKKFARIPRDRYQQEKISQELIGLVVFTRYNNKTHKVAAVNWDLSPRDTFKRSDSSEITFVDYYMQQYNQIITDLNQPLLVSQGKWRRGQRNISPEPILLVPELCYLTGLPDDVEQKPNEMGNLTKLMKQPPEVRKTESENFVRNVNKNLTEQSDLQCWSLSFDTNCLSVLGRVLGGVKVVQRKKSFDVNQELAEWMRESRSTWLLSAKSLNKWVLLYPKEYELQAKALQHNLKRVNDPMGVTGDEGYLQAVDDPNSYISTLQRCVTSQTTMVVCVLPDNEKYRYDAIKKYLCIKCPTPSQCVLAETLEFKKTYMTIITKIAQQMNCKMGGALWKVQTNLRKTMFVGIDCFHDIINRQNSIAGFVASINEELTQWHSQCIFQEPGQEIVNGLNRCLEAALNSWFKNLHYQPNSVVVYRDGVGDGQLQYLLDCEIPQLVSQLNKLKIKLTFIVVKKRINTRFFTKSEEMFKNPPSGTVVDVALTRHEWYDFYIVSQTSKYGTVTPTHYNVIYDTVCLDPDTVQNITYRLCHMYFNFPGAIRVPAPCHYAHKLAYFVGQNIQQAPHNALSNSLYYL